MLIGPVVDLRNYKEYSERFQRCLGDKLSVAEVHLLERDIISKKDFIKSIRESASYYNDLGVTQIAYHLLDDVINNIIIHDIFGNNPEYNKLLPAANLDLDKSRLEIQLKAIESVSEIFHGKTIAVVHEGIFFKTTILESSGNELLLSLRNRFFDRIKEIHSKYFPEQNNNYFIYLENSPPFRGDGATMQHFTDQVLSDMVPRLCNAEQMVFDVSHAFMSRHYLNHNHDKVFGLNLFKTLRWNKSEDKGPMNNYDEIAELAPFIGWIHLNDCAGLYGDAEGMPLFQENSLIDWSSLLVLLKQMAAPMILEISGAEKDFSLIERSLINLMDTWENI